MSDSDHIIGTALESVERGDLVSLDSSGAFIGVALSGTVTTDGTATMSIDTSPAMGCDPKPKEIIGELRAAIDAWLAGALT